MKYVDFGFASAFAVLSMSFAAGGAAAAPDEGPQALAMIGREIVSDQDLDKSVLEHLSASRESYELRAAQLKVEYERNRHGYLEKQTGALLDERVLTLEALARKSTPAALLAGVKAAPTSEAQAQAFYDSNKAQINKPYAAVAAQIKEYLQMQATDAAHRKYFDTLRSKYHAVITLTPQRDAVVATGPALGPIDAPVTIVEFSDFQCPFCGKFAPTLRAVLDKYPTQVRLVYRHLPLSTLHPKAEKAAEAAVCAEAQGKFWEMYDALFREQNALEVADLKDKAGRLGLDTVRFDACLDSGQAAGTVHQDTLAAQRLALAATPSTFINGRYLNGSASLEELSRLIDEELHTAATEVRR